ncbi:MAG: NAD(P)H-hydrate dehydratase, partial [bacterium]
TPVANLYVDALLGTGLKGDPREPYDECIRELNMRSAPVVSVDIPSGLGGDYHLPFDPCVEATLTVTYGLPKLGMLFEPGYTQAGQIIVQELGFPDSIYKEESGPTHLISPYDMRDFLPKRRLTDHKGNAGRLSVFGGSVRYPGAAFLAGNAAATAGAGLVSLIGPEDLTHSQGEDSRDLIFPFVFDDIQEDPPEEYERFMRHQDAYVVGPGMDQSEGKRRWLERLVEDLQAPAVFDADGINNLSHEPEVFQQCENTVLTPHPGEAGRLLSKDISTVLKKPLESTKKLIELTGQTIVLKTSRPIIGHPDGTFSVNVTGTPALAKAGSGDVLSGMIGAFLAQGLDPGPAACLGTYLHGAGSRLIQQEEDIVTVRSPQLLDCMSEAFRELEEGGCPNWYPVKFESHSRETLHWHPFN